LTVALGLSGCATKGFVRRSVEPVQNRVEEVDAENRRQGEVLGRISKDVEENEVALSATREKLGGVEAQAGQALARSDQNRRDIGQLRGELYDVVANIDAFQPVREETVLFGFDQDTRRRCSSGPTRCPPRDTG
jgi:hypothetical protein